LPIEFGIVCSKSGRKMSTTVGGATRFTVASTRPRAGATNRSCGIAAITAQQVTAAGDRAVG